MLDSNHGTAGDGDDRQGNEPATRVVGFPIAGLRRMFLFFRRLINFLKGKPKSKPADPVSPMRQVVDDDFLFYDENRSIMSLPDGGIRAGSFGNFVETGKDGVKVDMKSISGIGFHNIIDLKSYSIQREDDKITHLFEFNNGSHGIISYRTSGKMENFSVTGGAGVSFTKEGHITLSHLPKPHQPPPEIVA